MELNVSVGGDIDLSSVVTGEVVWFDPDTEEMETRPKTLGDLVAEQLANKFVESLREEDGYRRMTKLVSDARLEAIRKRIDPMVQKAIDGEPIKLTNQYGEPTGKEVTLTQLIVDEAKKSLTVPARGRSGDTLIATIVREQVAIAMKKELVEALNEAKKFVVEAVKKSATEYITASTLERAANSVGTVTR